MDFAGRVAVPENRLEEETNENHFVEATRGGNHPVISADDGESTGTDGRRRRSPEDGEERGERGDANQYVR
jgi:hypothetical protein